MIWNLFISAGLGINSSTAKSVGQGIRQQNPSWAKQKPNLVVSKAP